jgi:hypothetical protein
MKINEIFYLNFELHLIPVSVDCAYFSVIKLESDWHDLFNTMSRIKSQVTLV